MKPRSIARRRPDAAAIEPPASRRWHSPRHRGWWIAAIAIVGLLVLLQLTGSSLAKRMINQKLADMPDYTGRVESVTVALWRAAVDVRQFELRERGFENQPALLQVEKASVRLAPGALLGGKLGGSMTVEGLEVNTIKRIDDDTSAGGRDEEEREAELKAEAREKKEAIKRWQDQLRQAFPMELTQFELTQGRIRIADMSKDPQAELVLQNLHVVATDMQNRPKADGDPLPAKVNVEGAFAGGGVFRASAQLDPMSKQPRFSAAFEVRELSLPSINSYLLAYANADVSRGTFELYSEIEARDGRYEGYVKPLFHDLDFRTASDRDKNAAELLAKKMVSAVASVLENDEREQVATRTPFAGNFQDNEIDIWATIATLFRNAFVQALRGGFESEQPRR